MTCCKGAEYGNWCDGLETIVGVDGKEYCIFHAPADHKDPKQLKNAFYEKLRSAKANENLSFRGSVFNTPIIIQYLKIKIASIDFSHSEFNEEFATIKFYVSGCLNLSNCHFKASMSLRRTYVDDSILLNNSTFDKNFFWYKLITKEKLEIKKSRLPKMIFISMDAPPRNLIFSPQTCTTALISSVYDIKKTNENCQLTLKTEDPHAKVKINNFHISNVYAFNSLFEKVHFEHCTIEEVNLTNHQMTFDLSFYYCKFKKILLSTATPDFVKLIGCKFPKASNQRQLTSDALEVLYPKIDLSKTSPQIEPLDKYRALEELYRNLKKHSREAEANTEASDWHYWEKFFCEKRLFTEGTTIEWLIFRLYRLLSDYGESVEKASSWLLVFILTPLLFAYLSQLPLPVSGIDLANVAKQGLDYIPLATRTPVEGTWSRLFQMFWQILTTFQATLLGFALRNRYRR